MFERSDDEIIPWQWFALTFGLPIALIGLVWFGWLPLLIFALVVLGSLALAWGVLFAADRISEFLKDEREER